MSQDREASTSTKKRNGGFFHRLFGRSDGHEASPVSSPLDLEDIQGIILRGYRMPIVRHFLLKVDAPAAARKLLGRLVSGDEADAPQITTARDWHVGFEPGPGRQSGGAPAPQARLLPEPGHHLARIAGARGQGSRSQPLVQVVQRVRRRGRRAGGTGRRHRRQWAAELDRRFRNGKRSRHADAARRESRRP